jgi:DHA2 family methylenomycin A resistance protein-like MFS transporter
MLDFACFRQPFLAVATGCAFVMNAGFFTVYLFSTLFLQNVAGVGPLAAGWFLLGNNAAFFVANLGCGALANAIGKRAAGLAGLLAGGAGIAMYAAFDERTPPALLLLPLILTGLAWGSAMTPVDALALSVAPEEAEGLDASLLNLGRPLGAVLATAIFGSIIAAAIASAPALNETRAAGFVAGMHRTAIVAAVLTVAAFLVAWFTTRRTTDAADGSGRSAAGSARP